MRSLALAALLLVACSDDPVGRGNLPAHAGFRVTVESVSEERCRDVADSYEPLAFTFTGLDGDAPEITVALMTELCAWESGSLLRCSATGDEAIDFAAEAVEVTREIDDDPATPACVMVFAMGEVIDLDAQ